MAILDKLLYALFWLCSLLPFWLMYAISDCAYFVVRYVVRYRRQVVRSNLRSAFPQHSEQQLDQVEAGFYHFFCDQFVEMVKQFSMSRETMMKRMRFEGLDQLRDSFSDDVSILFVMLGHYGNWEWIASLQYWLDDVHCTQIYHRLYNRSFDRLLLNLRQHYGGECITMKDTARRLIRLKAEGRKTVVGFIADQQPKWRAIHHFTPFLHHDTAVFTGAETLARKLNAVLYYGHVTRPRRGYYVCQMQPIGTPAPDAASFDLTDTYMQLLEHDIVAVPHLWLWSHKRWSRTKERWLERQAGK